MGKLNIQTSPAVGKAPSTGGSGGGPNPAVWTPPSPGHVLGLNSMVVYGGNIQIAFPINFQMAFGSNLQVCINPSALEALFLEENASGAGPRTAPPQLNAALGGGMGGNMQLTMGMSANVVMGQIFDINLGPKRITVDVHTVTAIQAGCKTLALVIGALTAVVLLVYIIPNDDVRSQTLIIYQVAMQVLLTLVMDLQAMYYRLDHTGRNAIRTALGAPELDPDEEESSTAPTVFTTPTGNQWLTAAILVIAFQVPFLLESIGEAMMDAPQPPAPSQPVVDSVTGAPVDDAAGNPEVVQPSS